MDCLSVAHIFLTVCVSHVLWNSEPGPPIDASSAHGSVFTGILVPLGVGLADTDLVSQKSRLLTPCVRDKRFGLGLFQLELFLQKRSDFLFDFFRFRLR